MKTHSLVIGKKFEIAAANNPQLAIQIEALLANNRSESLLMFRGKMLKRLTDELRELYKVTQKALDEIEPDEVLVRCLCTSHNMGPDWGHQLVAVPRSTKRSWALNGSHPNFALFQSHDSNSERSYDLPDGARVWNGKRWRNRRRLTYNY